MLAALHLREKASSERFKNTEIEISRTCCTPEDSPWWAEHSTVFGFRIYLFRRKLWRVEFKGAWFLQNSPSLFALYKACLRLLFTAGLSTETTLSDSPYRNLLSVKGAGPQRCKEASAEKSEVLLEAEYHSHAVCHFAHISNIHADYKDYNRFAICNVTV